jgi:hypothetical protein
MTKLVIIIAAGLLFAGAASAAPLTDHGTSTSDSTGTQVDQTQRTNANEKATTGAGAGGSMNGMSGTRAPAKNGMQNDSMQKNKSPASPNAGVKQEK